jgi:hypothetical protein
METLAAGVDEPLLSEQVRTAVIDAVCRCGCSSVRLRSNGPAIPPARVAQLSDHERDDFFRVQAFSNDPAQELVSVELHVQHGRVEELEVYDMARGDGVAVPLAGIPGLDEVTVS